MALTTAQISILAAALRAEADPTTAAAVISRNDTYLAGWCNGLSATDAWNQNIESRDLFDATNVAKFDNLTAGKRSAWDLLLRFAPVDMSRQKMRKAVEDIWGTADSVAVLQACTRKATRGEVYIGGSTATTNTVSALKLDFTGAITIEDIGAALNG